MSDKNEDERLADGWILCKSKSNPGRKYYFNRKTGKSSWTKPQAEEKSQNSKQKGKKEKIRVEKATKEEQKISLKRKSDSHEINPPQKKPKQETPTSERRKPSGSNKHGTPIKYLDSHKKKNASPLPPTPKKTPTKNIASARLSMLRAQLNSEIDSKPETEKSPVKSKNKINTNTPEAKVAKLDLKSPNSNETKSSTTQSPGSDSLQSTPSPSQFLTANKIIYSMKAQLPEEYCNKQMPKDTFADIEQGICNQTPEFPSTKHPATPPQFSEASKLVSAIKSKLSYKVQSTKDVTIKQYSSAKERMEALRVSISDDNIDPNETVSDCSLSKVELPKPRTAEAMDFEDCNQVDLNSSCTKPTLEVKNNVVLVVDTNIFIHELDVIKMVINSHIKGYSEQPTLLVPWRVINELDRLKDNNNGNGAICKRARAAMDYLYKSLPENSRIKGQSLRDSHSHIYPCESPDDEILNCCLQQAERGNNVMLISNDKNLCNKAVMNQVKCIALNELKPLLENKPQPTADPDLCASFHHYKDHMYSLLATILENEMRAKYDNLWQHVIFRPPPWTLGIVLQCILKHWIAVFNEVFPRIEFVITDLKNSLFAIDNKDPKSLSQSEVTNFKDLCLEIARKCQIIPEYMELAKATLERLTRPPEPRPAEPAAGEGCEGGQMPIIESFERLWIVFSSYSAKISSALGIPHNVEDRIPGEDGLQLLSGRWSLFSRHVHNITVALESVAQCPAAPASEEAVAALAAAFLDSLALVGLDSTSVTQESVRQFADLCRNMIQEAYAKFANLTNLLRLCENNLANN